jgi:hypothetical protein
MWATKPGRRFPWAGLRTGVALVVILGGLRVFLASPYVSVSYVICAAIGVVLGVCWAGWGPARGTAYRWLWLGVAAAGLFLAVYVYQRKFPAARPIAVHGPTAAATPGDASAKEDGDTSRQTALHLATEHYCRLTGAEAFSEPQDVDVLPRFAAIDLPNIPGADAIWGAPGRDGRGHVWFGVSTRGGALASAHLCEYVPASKTVVDRGDAITELKRCGVYREGESQSRINSSITQGADGQLYFATHDREGGNQQDKQDPTWGSHAWRYRLAENRWEHLFAAPEALTGLGGAGNDLYAMGYLGHTLYHYDISSAKLSAVKVGSTGGHASGNLLCDYRGHAYVLRLRSNDPKGAAPAALVEFDPQLTEIGETSLEHYSPEGAADANPPPGDRDGDTHPSGITAFQTMADGTIVFATTAGYLYRIVQHQGGNADVKEIGWFHPEGEACVEAMCTFDGDRWVVGIGNRGDRLEWLVYDLGTKKASATPLPKDSPLARALWLCGDQTCDNQGAMYLGGARRRARIEDTPDLARALRAVGMDPARLSPKDEAASKQRAEPVLFREVVAPSPL